jgi:minor extracellular serine protease Vpr
VGEVGGTGRETISVGAFTSRSQYTNINGNLVPEKENSNDSGAIAHFSSMGPTVDNRVKPDIAAPGDWIISSFRSDFRYDASMDNYITNWVDAFSTRYPYGAYHGTSMSSPFVAGAVALLLEANPTLSPDQVKLALTQSAKQDEFTGAISNDGDNSWGAGKIDVKSAIAFVKDSLKSSSTTSFTSKVTVRALSERGMELSLTSAKVSSVAIAVYDLRGRRIANVKSSLTAGENLLSVPMESVAQGTYIYKIQGDGVNVTGKMALVP